MYLTRPGEITTTSKVKVLPLYKNVKCVLQPILESMGTDLLTYSFPAIHSDSRRIWKLYVIASQSSITARTKLDMIVLCPLNAVNRNNMGIRREGEQEDEQKKRIHEQSMRGTEYIYFLLKYKIINNILTWLRRFTWCNRLGRA